LRTAIERPEIVVKAKTIQNISDLLNSKPGFSRVCCLRFIKRDSCEGVIVVNGNSDLLACVVDGEQDMLDGDMYE